VPDGHILLFLLIHMIPRCLTVWSVPDGHILLFFIDSHDPAFSVWSVPNGHILLFPIG
jgi:hypothetical protein